MFTVRNMAAAMLIALTTGCATGLNSVQESELASYRARNLAVEEKSPGLAAGLGFLRITLAVPLAISTRVGQRTSRSCYEYEAGKYRYH